MFVNLNVELLAAVDTAVGIGRGGSAGPVLISTYEGQNMWLACESCGGKPIPCVACVTWYSGRGKVVAGKTSSFEEPDGIDPGHNVICFGPGFNDLFNEFMCIAETRPSSITHVCRGLDRY